MTQNLIVVYTEKITCVIIIFCIMCGVFCHGRTDHMVVEIFVHLWENVKSNSNRNVKDF